MTTPSHTTLTAEVRLARRVLAELAERGAHLLSRDVHLDILLALDNLELAAHGLWPPPDPARQITDVRRALTDARDALAVVVADLGAHDVEPVRAVLARDHVDRALARLS